MILSDTSPATQAHLVERIAAILDLGFQEDQSEQARARVAKEYLRQLLGFPRWAIDRGFDTAIRSTPKRRPLPGEIRAAIEIAMQPIRDELAHRRKIEADRRRQDDQRRADRVTPEQADAILREHGMTPQRIAHILGGGLRPTPAAIDQPEPDPEPDEPPRPVYVQPSEALQRARAANPIIARAMAKARRREQPDEARAVTQEAGA